MAKLISILKRVSLLCGISMILISCQKETGPTESPIKKDKISGYFQKGPYVNGTLISMFELDTSLVQTGKSFTTQIVNNQGSFEINNIVLGSRYVEFSGTGYYFNEIGGQVSSSPLTLLAISDIRDISTINVNILTHLEKDRVKHLVGKGNKFADAKSVAQGEVLSLFGFSKENMDNSEGLDISVNRDENALLLAISIILQGNRSVGTLTEILANIITEIKLDGILNNQSLLSDLRNSTLNLDLPAIRSNLVGRYQELGITATIPDFEKYVNEFLSFTGKEPDASTHNASEITTTSATLNGLVNANDLSTTVTFEYGATATYGTTVSASQSPLSGHSNTTVNAVITDLNPSTIYHYRVKSVNSLGTVYGNDLTFLTSGKVPDVTTEDASGLTTYSATLNGLVNPNEINTIVTFEYGLTIGYGNSIPASQSPITGKANTSVNAGIADLMPRTTYHYRIVASNSLGTTNGDDRTFTTLGASPTVSVLDATDITLTSAQLNGTVNANYFLTSVTFDYGTTTDYGNTISAIQSPVNGNSIVSISVIINNLSPGEIFHFRIRSVNELGSSTSSDLTFGTFAVMDCDYNYYNAVTIGDQIWMKENLKTTHLNDESPIPEVEQNYAWSGLETPAFSWFNNDEAAYKNTYGALYNWYVVNTGKLCPSGWHVPTELDWKELEMFLGMSQTEYNKDGWIFESRGTLEGAKLKESGIAHWYSPNTEATNETEFTALPGGYRNPTIWGFYNMGEHAGFWTSTQFDQPNAWARSLNHDKPWISRGSFDKKIGYSIRCLKD